MAVICERGTTAVECALTSDERSPMRGIVEAGRVVLDQNGLPIVETTAPAIPVGMRLVEGYQVEGQSIVQTWTLVPEQGTAQEATIKLAQLQAASLTDEVAAEVPALFDAWKVGVAYEVGVRVNYQGVLYKCLQAHTSQATWAPSAAPSIWAEVLPGQSGNETKPDGTPGEWKQPGSTNGYAKGDKVTHNGKTWVSNVDNNVWEPGATGVTQWDEVK